MPTQFPSPQVVYFPTKNNGPGMILWKAFIHRLLPVRYPSKNYKFAEADQTCRWIRLNRNQKKRWKSGNLNWRTIHWKEEGEIFKKEQEIIPPILGHIIFFSSGFSLLFSFFILYFCRNFYPIDHTVWYDAVRICANSHRQGRFTSLLRCDPLRGPRVRPSASEG